MYPILFERRCIAIDTMGCGEWNGGPATEGVYRSLSGEMTVAFCSDGDTYPACGVLGGLDGAPSGNWKRHGNGELERLPSFHLEALAPHEAVIFRSCAGGGYGDPVQRDPERVAKDIARQWLSRERAELIYKVALVPSEDGVG